MYPNHAMGLVLPHLLMIEPWIKGGDSWIIKGSLQCLTKEKMLNLELSFSLLLDTLIITAIQCYLMTLTMMTPLVNIESYSIYFLLARFEILLFTIKN